MSSNEVVNLDFQFNCPVIFDKLHCSPEPTWSMALAQSVVLKLRVHFVGYDPFTNYESVFGYSLVCLLFNASIHCVTMRNEWIHPDSSYLSTLCIHCFWLQI